MRVLEVPIIADGPASTRPKTKGPGPGAKSFARVLGEQVGPRPDPKAGAASPAAPAVEGAPGRPAKGPTGRALLERLVGAENRVDALLSAAARGKTFSASELIALQASVFRYSQTVEVVSRVADRVVGGIKQTLGTNV